MDKSNFLLNNTDKKTNLTILFFLLSLTLSFPLFIVGVVSFYISYLHDKPQNKKYRYVLYFLLAFCISYINLSKPVHISDLGYYYWLFEYAGQKDFLEFVSIIPKEPLFHIYTFCMYVFTLGNFNLFLFLNTILIYVLIMVSYDKIFRILEISTKYAIFAAVLLLLFSEFFFYTAQIIRQVLAGSIALYAITSIFCDGKKSSFFLLLSVGFIHASAFFFYVAFIIYFIKDFSLRNKLILLIFFIVGYAVILKILGNFFTDDSTLTLAINRGLNSSSEKVSLGLFPLLVCFSVLPMNVGLILKTEHNSLCDMLAVPIACLLLMLMNLSESLFVLRFMEYIYMYIPIVLVLFLKLVLRMKDFLSFLLVAFMLYRFAAKLSTSDFQFLSFQDFVTSGLPKYLITIF